MNVSLDKKVIVISGGTKGVGKQLALQCAADGAYVIISGRDEASATDIVSAAFSPMSLRNTTSSMAL